MAADDELTTVHLLYGSAIKEDYNGEDALPWVSIAQDNAWKFPLFSPTSPVAEVGMMFSSKAGRRSSGSTKIM